MIGEIRGDVQPEDLVCVLDGMLVLCTIRPAGNGDNRLIGTAAWRVSIGTNDLKSPTGRL